MADGNEMQALLLHEGTSRRRANTADSIVDYLAVEGVDTVFGVPGGPIVGLFDALALKSHVRVVLCKHEQGAVAAACGHALISGRVGVAVVTSGPGITNTLTALAGAFHDRVPVLLIAGQVATQQVGRGAVHDSSPFGTDVIAMATPVTAMAVEASSGEQARILLPMLLRRAHCSQQPVLLMLPADVQFDAPAQTTLPRTGYRIGHFAPFDHEAAARALESIRCSTRIVVLVGWGARALDRPLLVSFCESLGAAVATTPKGKGLFPEDHPLSLGGFGFAGSPRAAAALLHSEVDTLIVLGSALGELASDAWQHGLRPALMIQVDRDPCVIGSTYPALGVVGDVQAVVRHWRSALEATSTFAPGKSGAQTPRVCKTEWLQKLQAATPRTMQAPTTTSMEIPLRPERAFFELDSCMPANATIMCDIGNTMAYAIHYLAIRATQRFFVNLGFASMGHAVPAAVGAQLADSTRPVLALVGDAAFAMSGFEVHTALEYRAPSPSACGPVFVVFNNGGNGMVDVGVRKLFGDSSDIDTGCYRGPLDIATIARGLGAHGVLVTRPGELSAAVLDALTPGRGPTVIDLRIAMDATPPLGSRLETLLHSSRRDGVRP